MCLAGLTWGEGPEESTEVHQLCNKLYCLLSTKKWWSTPESIYESYWLPVIIQTSRLQISRERTGDVLFLFEAKCFHGINLVTLLSAVRWCLVKLWKRSPITFSVSSHFGVLNKVGFDRVGQTQFLSISKHATPETQTGESTQHYTATSYDIYAAFTSYRRFFEAVRVSDAF